MLNKRLDGVFTPLQNLIFCPIKIVQKFTKNNTETVDDPNNKPSHVTYSKRVSHLLKVRMLTFDPGS